MSEYYEAAEHGPMRPFPKPPMKDAGMIKGVGETAPKPRAEPMEAPANEGVRRDLYWNK